MPAGWVVNVRVCSVEEWREAGFILMEAGERINIIFNYRTKVKKMYITL